MEKEDAVNVLQFWLAADNFQSQLAAKEGQYDGQEAQNDAMILYDKWGSSTILYFCTCGFVFAVQKELLCILGLVCWGAFYQGGFCCVCTHELIFFWHSWGEILIRILFLNIIQDFQDLIAWFCLVVKYQSWLVDVWKWKGFKPNSRKNLNVQILLLI